MKKPINLDFDTALELVNRAIEERGEGYVYEPVKDAGCLYVHREPVWDAALGDFGDNDKLTPGCLIGTALHLAGVPLRMLATYEEMGADSVVASLVEQGEIGSATEEARSFLDNAQAYQDRGKSWGVARDMGRLDAEV